MLYLKGISTGDFTEALEAILGPNAAGLSPTNIVRLKEGWEVDYEAWTKRDLTSKRYVYWWADGICFPAEHWRHIRTTNPIESSFATVRHRQRQTKGCGSRLATLTMVFKLAKEAERHWRKLNGSEMLPKVIADVIFIAGVMEKAA